MAPAPAPAVAGGGVGDVGRSPRMQYHAKSLAAAPGAGLVHVVGLRGSPPLAELAADPHVALRLFPGCARLPLPLRLLWQAVALLWILLFRCPGLRGGAVLVQNPPCIPAFAVARLATWLLGARLVVDWHNYGYSIMAVQRGGRRTALVRGAEAYERLLGPLADGALCVTDAMARDLRENWGVRAVSVMHDRPPEIFQPLKDPADAHALHLKLRGALSEAIHGEGDCCSASYGVGDGQEDPNDTLFTSGFGARPARSAGGAQQSPRLRQDRPALVVSSTSWTADEDFGILLEAAEIYEARARADPALPRVLFAITGKGPEKARYLSLMRAKSFRRVAFRTLWLDFEDYPRLLATADLGVSLHTSSSGLDLPMKVVDMFGCGLPVCAANFPCLDELVRDGTNGRVFTGPEELARQLEGLLSGFPGGNPELARLRAGARAWSTKRWDAEWAARAAPVLAAGRHAKARSKAH